MERISDQNVRVRERWVTFYEERRAEEDICDLHERETDKRKPTLHSNKE